MSGARHRRKGNAIERQLVASHRDIGIHCERYPLSGASKFRGSGHDLDVYVFGREAAPLVAEVKGRKNGQGFALLEKWLSTFDLLFLRRNRQEPLVVLPWRTYVGLLRGGANGSNKTSARRGTAQLETGASP
ncbi:MAG: hypothetical protein J2P48_10955 [Alphaproteobacteria bacterium]|nr:hypothetical protein [Alphaproteobacteria bacterium]